MEAISKLLTGRMDPPVGRSEAPSNEGTGKYQAAELLWVRPGVTKVSDLSEHPIFKDPMSTAQTGEYEVRTYQFPEMEEMPYVQVLVKDGVVAGLVIHLSEPRDLEDARQSFGDLIRGLRPVAIRDSEGNFREIYPERGFSFVLMKSGDYPDSPTRQVVQVVSEEIKPDFFIVRANESRKRVFGSATISDVCHDASAALDFQPQNASAAWMVAGMNILTEDYPEAAENAERAVKANARVPEYHFTLINALRKTGQMDAAIADATSIVGLCASSPFHSTALAVAKAELQLARPEPECDSAIQEIQAAIQTLKPLIKKGNPQEQTHARQMLIEAYCALARLIATKDWKKADEQEKASLWIDAAGKYASALDSAEEGNPMLMFESELIIGLAAAEVWLEIPENANVGHWVDRMENSCARMLSERKDPLEREAISFHCGEAMLYAFFAAETRGDDAKREEYGRKAYKYLEPYCESKPEKVVAVLGHADYELGIFFNELAKEENSSDPDHVRAMNALGRAGRMIDQNLAMDGTQSDGYQGIRLVNIGKAFWGDRQQNSALQYTEHGVAAIEKAVENGNMDKGELLVPYQNLVSIYTAMGETVKADIYGGKAEELEDKQ